MQVKTETILAVWIYVQNKSIPGAAKLYIQHFTMRSNKKLIPHYTSDVHLAHDFVTESNVTEKISRIDNYAKVEYLSGEIQLSTNTRKHYYIKTKI